LATNTCGEIAVERKKGQIRQGVSPCNFIAMMTRISLLIVIIGLIVLWLGLTQGDKFLGLIGISAVIIGILSATWSINNKTGMGFLKRL